MRQMKLLLLIIGLALVRGTHDHEEHHENVNEQKWLIGSWHTIAVAANNTAKIKKGGPFRLSLHQIMAKGDKLYGEFSERCLSKSTWGWLHPLLGFSCSSVHPENSGANIFYFTHVKADEYIMATLYNYDASDVTLVLMLVARHPDVKEEIKKKFKELCLNNNLNEENIVYFTRYDEGENRIYIRNRDGSQALLLITRNIQEGKKTTIVELYGKCAPHVFPTSTP
ncbi:trichosurin-like [Sarcophilus harrisii]